MLYRFDAPVGHTLLVGDEVHEPGAELELPAGQVDPRLTAIGEAGEEDNPVAVADDRSLSEIVRDEVDSINGAEAAAEAEAGGPLGRSEPESAAKPDEPTGFGNPKPRSSR